MRRVLALLLVSLALASPAGADQKPAPKKAPPRAVIVIPQSALPPIIPLASNRPGGDADQCRSSCARGYYFCKVGDDDSCPAVWAQCKARCTATYRPLGS